MRVVVGRQATALVVSCHTAESSPRTSFLHFCRVLNLVPDRWLHCDVFDGHAAESQNVGCRLEHFCCRVIEIPDFLFRVPFFESGRSLLTH